MGIEAPICQPVGKSAAATALASLEPGIIYIDTSIGSREFQDPIRKNHGLKTELRKLNSGDFAFRCGHSEPSPYCAGDYGCLVAIERKTLSDLIGSLLKNRLGGRQIPLMLEEFTMAYIMIEGRWRQGVDDQIEQVVWASKKDDGIEILKWRVARSALTYTQLAMWLTRYDVQGNGKLRQARTSDIADSAAFIAAKYGWWRKEWKKHSIGLVDKMPMPNKALLWRPDEWERVVGSLDTIGIKGVKKLSPHFDSILEFMLSSPKALQAAGLGKAAAYGVWDRIRRSRRR